MNSSEGIFPLKRHVIKIVKIPAVFGTLDW